MSIVEVVMKRMPEERCLVYGNWMERSSFECLKGKKNEFGQWKMDRRRLDFEYVKQEDVCWMETGKKGGTGF